MMPSNMRGGRRRARDEARQAARQYRVVGRDGDILRRTRIDLDKAQIVYSDADGEMRVETVDGKKMLTAKDPQGRLVFSGPIEKQEDIERFRPTSASVMTSSNRKICRLRYPR